MSRQIPVGFNCVKRQHRCSGQLPLGRDRKEQLRFSTTSKNSLRVPLKLAADTTVCGGANRETFIGLNVRWPLCSIRASGRLQPIRGRVYLEYSPVCAVTPSGNKANNALIFITHLRYIKAGVKAKNASVDLHKA